MKKIQWMEVPNLKEEMFAIGRRLLAIRKQKNLTLEELSKATAKRNPSGRGVTSAQISRIENGLVGTDIIEIKLICMGLDYELGQLMIEAFAGSEATLVDIGKREIASRLQKSLIALENLCEVVRKDVHSLTAE